MMPLHRTGTEKSHKGTSTRWGPSSNLKNTLFCLKSTERMDTMDDPDFYYKGRADSIDVIATRFRPKASKTLIDKKWRAAFDQQGRLDISKVLIRIQKGGVHPLIRGEVWEFLLGCFDPGSTYVKREDLRRLRREEYLKLKAECQVMDTAVGSGKVVTLPRINEDGSPVENVQQRHIKDDCGPSINGHKAENTVIAWHVDDTTSSRGRSLISELQEDDGRDGLGFHSERVQVEDDGLSGQLKADSSLMPRSAKFHRSSPIRAVENDYSQEGVHVSPGAVQTVSGHCLDKLHEGKRQTAGTQQEDKKVIQWRLILHQVGLDVVRTDRNLQFYERPEHLAKLWDILAVYAWIDPDIGYCQGMSDLCSPMVVLFQNEADAFWCFKRLMGRLRENFRCTEQAVGVQKQLANLGSVLQVVDPKLHQHLDDLGGGSYIFAFRMLMVLFRREFSFADSLYLWEMMWALEYDPQTCISPRALSFHQQQGERGGVKQEFRNGWIARKEKTWYKWGKFQRQNLKYGLSNSHGIPFVVFCTAGIFESQRTRLQEAPGLDEVVKILNDITGKLDAKKACKEALKIHKKYLLKGKKIP